MSKTQSRTSGNEPSAFETFLSNEQKAILPCSGPEKSASPLLATEAKKREKCDEQHSIFQQARIDEAKKTHRYVQQCNQALDKYLTQQTSRSSRWDKLVAYLDRIAVSLFGYFGYKTKNKKNCYINSELRPLLNDYSTLAAQYGQASTETAKGKSKQLEEIRKKLKAVLQQGIDRFSQLEMQNLLYDAQRNLTHHLLNTPKDLTPNIFSYLRKEAAAVFPLISKRANTLFKDPTVQQQLELSKDQFLVHIARGEQNEAEAILKTAAKDPTLFLHRLLTTKATMKDHAGRIFKNISAFQYTLWALDRHMWQMILKYMPDDLALAQLQEHEMHGVSYELEGKTTHEKHYDFSPLKKALQETMTNLKDYYDEQPHTYVVINNRRWFRSAFLDRTHQHWREKVGQAQRYVPAHVAQEYLREDRSFCSRQTFKEDQLPRKLSFYNHIIKRVSSWFTSLHSHYHPYAMCRGNVTVSNSPSLSSIARENPDTFSIAVDLDAIIALSQVRTQEYSELSDYLHAKKTAGFTVRMG